MRGACQDNYTMDIMFHVYFDSTESLQYISQINKHSIDLLQDCDAMPKQWNQVFAFKISIIA